MASKKALEWIRMLEDPAGFYLLSDRWQT